MASLANDDDHAGGAASVIRSRGLAPTQFGLVHYTTNIDALPKGAVGVETPLVCMHMSPRSCDEYAEVSSLFASGDRPRLVVAVDELGYGSSDSPNRSMTLEEMADTVLAVVDSLGLTQFAVAGSLMGCYMAMSLAARYRERVTFLVLTNPYLWRDEAVAKAKQEAASAAGARENMADGQWKMLEDGSHFTQVWNARSAWLSAELNTRCTMDDCVYRLKRNARYRRGIDIQAPQLFDFAGAASKVTCNTLAVFGGQAVEFFDMIGFAMTEQSKKAIACFTAVGNLREHLIEGGSINMLNDRAAEWVGEVSKAL